MSASYLSLTSSAACIVKLLEPVVVPYHILSLLAIRWAYPFSHFPLANLCLVRGTNTQAFQASGLLIGHCGLGAIACRVAPRGPLGVRFISFVSSLLAAVSMKEHAIEREMG